MEFLFTKEELEKYQQKKNAKKQKVDNEKIKLDKYQQKYEIILDKQIAKEDLRHTKQINKLEAKQEAKLNAIKAKYESDQIVEQIQNFYAEKIVNENEIYEIAKENFRLAKKDLIDGVESTNKNNYKVHVESLEIKISKENWKRNWKKINQNKSDNFNKREETYKLYEESDKKYKPNLIKFDELKENYKNKFDIFKTKTQIKFLKSKQFTFKDWINIKIWTIPLWLALAFLGIVLAAIFTGIVDTNMIYAPAILLIIAIFTGTLFSKIPIWKKYFGGAVMGSMFVGAFLVYFHVIGPDSSEIGKGVYDSLNMWFKEQNFLSLYISFLLVGAVLLMPRKLILKATGGFFVLIIAGTVLGFVLASFSTLFTGMSMQELILNYALPILADGNGGGVQPMGDIAAANGYDRGEWVSRALAISTLASIISVVAAAIVSGVGKSKPSLSGNGQLMLKDIHTVDRTAKVSDRNIASSLLLIYCIYILSDIFAEAIFPESLIGIVIPNFAWMIVLCLILNLINIIPIEMRLGAEKVNKFISKQTTWLLMVGVGILYIDLEEFISALNPEALLVTILFVLGAAVGPMLIAKFFKFNCVEASVTAGLCMTAQGGSGAIAVLGTSDRMNLMPFGQITCRIAGSVMLVFAAFAFAYWPAETTQTVNTVLNVAPINI